MMKSLLFLDVASPVPIILAGGFLMLLGIALVVCLIIAIVLIVRTVRRRNAAQTPEKEAPKSDPDIRT